MEFSLDMMNIGDADAFIIWEKHNSKDYVIFVDGGKESDGPKVISHYNNYIKSYFTSLLKKPEIIIINTHQHNDHLMGLFHIVDELCKMGHKPSRVYMNNPHTHISQKSYDLLKSNYEKSEKKQDDELTRLFESFNRADDFAAKIKKLDIPIYKAMSKQEMYVGDESLFKFFAPSLSFYKQQIDLYTSETYITSLSEKKILLESEDSIMDDVEVKNPCPVVDEKDDASPENLCSAITCFQSTNRKLILTGDAGVNTFKDAILNGFDIERPFIFQLPHHGSRRNINSEIITKVQAEQIWISAAGNKKHPRKAVIVCIKKNSKKTKIYLSKLTTGDWLHINSSNGVFPDREGSKPAEALWDPTVPVTL